MKKSLNVIFRTTSSLLFCFIAAFATAQAQTTVEFTSGVQFGSQSNNVSLLVADDLVGHNDLQAVRTANWTDVGKKAGWATDKEQTPSGTIDLGKVTEKGKPFYIAFRYLGQASGKPSQRGWSIQNVKVAREGQTRDIKGSDIVILQSPDNHEGAGWKTTGSGIRFSSNRSVTATESWAIIKID